MLLVSGIVLVVGIIGEIRSSEWGVWLKRFEYLVLIGVAGELIADGGVFLFSSHLQTISDHEVAETFLKASDADERSRTLVKENLLLQADVLRFQADVLRLRKESEPRRLTGTQRDALIRMLMGTRDSVAILSRVVDTESADFADDLNAALHDGAHWDTVRIRNRLSSRYGVSLGTVSGTRFSAAATRLDRALTAIGIAHDNPTFVLGDASTSPPFQSGFLYLVIEQHPPLSAPR